MKTIAKHTVFVAVIALLGLTSCKKETETTTETTVETTEDVSPMDTVVIDNDTVIETGTSKDVQAPAEDQVP